MKKSVILLIIFTCLNLKSYACSVDTTPIDKLIEDADSIFIGYVVEINYGGYEKNVKANYEDRPYEKGEDAFTLLGGAASYSYRTIPVKVFKQSREIPDSILTSKCAIGNIEGTGKYIIMLFKNLGTFGSQVWSSRDPNFKELESKLYDKFGFAN